MPSSASASSPSQSFSSPPANSNQSRPVPEDLIGRLNSVTASYDIKLKALRDLKNQIIGNRTKKVNFVKLGAVPAVVSVLSSAAVLSGRGEEVLDGIVIQSAAAIGSFACGFDDGVQAVLDAGALPILFGLVSHSNEKVVDAGARSLKLIYQSKLPPKYNFLEETNMEFLLSLLNSENENVNGLGASIITHSCQHNFEQNALGDAGVIKKLISLLGGSLIQRDASLESLSTILKDNPETASKFLGVENGRALNVVIEMTNDKHSRTRLLGCICLIVIRNTLPSYLKDVRKNTNLILILIELLDDPGQVGVDAPFALSSLIMEKEDMQKLAFEENVIEKLCNQLEKGSISAQAKRLQGTLLALAHTCSQLECCRSRLLSSKAWQCIIDALMHPNTEVRAASCICFRNVSRSVKNLSAGRFMNEMVIAPLVQLLCDTATCVQVAALGAISNVVVDFMVHKSTFIQCGGVKQLVHLSKSMDSTIRVNAVWALRNLLFLVDNQTKETIFSELTLSTITSLICDPEPSVQEQALAFVRNLVDGSTDCIEYIFAEDGILLRSVARQLESDSKSEVLVQGLYVLSNTASGEEIHKEAVMSVLFPPIPGGTQSILTRFLQSDDSRLRTAAAWAVVNLSSPSSPGALNRVVRLRNAGIAYQLKTMIHDLCLDVKLRVKIALTQFMVYGDGTP